VAAKAAYGSDIVTALPKQDGLYVEERMTSCVPHRSFGKNLQPRCIGREECLDQCAAAFRQCQRRYRHFPLRLHKQLAIMVSKRAFEPSPLRFPGPIGRNSLVVCRREGKFMRYLSYNYSIAIRSTHSTLSNVGISGANPSLSNLPSLPANPSVLWLVHCCLANSFLMLFSGSPPPLPSAHFLQPRWYPRSWGREGGPVDNGAVSGWGAGLRRRYYHFGSL
jgi:hypothetical protein